MPFKALDLLMAAAVVLVLVNIGTEAYLKYLRRKLERLRDRYFVCVKDGPIQTNTPFFAEEKAKAFEEFEREKSKGHHVFILHRGQVIQRYLNTASFPNDFGHA